MKKPVYGLILGGVLGVFDGLSSLVSAPETAPQVGSIVAGSTFKGLLAGALIGWVTGKVRTVTAGVVWGGVIGLFFAGLVSLAQRLSGEPAYYWEIMLPGTLVGGIVGYATFRYRERPRPAG